MSADLLIVTTLVVAVLGTGVVAVWKWRDPRYRRVIPSAVLSILAVLLVISGYRWWFETGTCSGRGDLVCVTNANQGILTLLAVGVAGLAIWVEVVARHAQRAREREVERQQATAVLCAAAEELHHNLLHIAPCFEGGRLRTPPPAISCDAVNALSRLPQRGFVHPTILDRVDPLQRTFSTIVEVRERALEGGWLTRRRIRRLLQQDPPPFQYFIGQSLSFLVYCQMFHADTCAQVLRQGELRDLPEIVRMYRATQKIEFFLRTSAREAQEKAAAIRTDQPPVLCWIDDESLDYEHVFEFCKKFQDAAIGHRH